jgi:Protein of unknown function (DUF1571)
MAAGRARSLPEERRMKSGQQLQSPARRAPGRWQLQGAVALVLLGAVYGVAPNRPSVRAADPAPAAADASPMDEPLRLIAEARSSFEKVTDYTCRLVKKERINGELTPSNVIAMSVRNEPFSVDLRWLEPKSCVGQEACYVAGRYDGKMRVKSAGLLGAVGFVSIDPTDPRAQKTSRHAITEAGIGNLIQRFAGHWEAERQLNLTQVKVGEYEYNKRRCIRVETVHPTNPDNQFLCYRTVLYFDKENHLPIRVEAYDWPHGESDKGELMEEVNYANLQLNVGVPDETFNH